MDGQRRPSDRRCPFIGIRTGMEAMKRLLLLAVGTLCVSGCGPSPRPAGGRTEEDTGDTARRFVPDAFLPRMPPADVAPAARAAWLRAHYWDGFDFADTATLVRADTLRMLGLFARHAALCAVASDSAPIDSLMCRASVSRTGLLYFWMLAERVLYDPNSPLRDDELYIPVLRTVVSSKLLTEWERLRPAEQLRLALRCRVGEPAADLRFVLSTGEESTLYDLQSDHTLLFVADPDCSACERLSLEVAASPLVNERLERGSLTLLYLLPRGDTEALRYCGGRLPASWLVACDDGTLFEGTYDLRAVPSLYLLDRTKRIVVKDTADVGAIEAALDGE